MNTRYLGKSYTNSLHFFQDRSKGNTAFPNSFYEASITVIPKSDKDILNYKSVSLRSKDAKILNKTLASQMQTLHEELCTVIILVWNLVLKGHAVQGLVISLWHYWGQ
jgi:hypothetical protein